MRVFSYNNCPALAGDFEVTDENAKVINKDCKDFRNRVFKFLKETQGIKKVFLANRNSLYVSESESSKFQYKRRLVSEGKAIGWESSMETFKESMQKTLRLLETKVDEVYILGEVPNFYESPHECLQKKTSLIARALRLWTNDELQACVGYDENSYQRSTESLNSFFESLGNASTKIHFFNPNGVYPLAMRETDQVYYFDENHMNFRGAKLLQKALVKRYFSEVE